MEAHRAGGSWIRFSPADGEPLVKLVCFHHGGGGASSFNGWRRLLPPCIELLRVQLPGREDNILQPPFSTVEALIPALMPHLEPLFDRPVAFYGHSFGAITAFEAARALRQRGLPGPVALFVSGRRAPQLPLSHPTYCLASDDEFITYLRMMGGTPEALLEKAHWRKRLFPTMRSDLRISDLYTYQPEPPLPCPIVFFAAANDTLVKPLEWQGWGMQTTAEFRLRVLDAGHFFKPHEQATIAGDVTAFLQNQLALGPAVGKLNCNPEACRETCP